MSAAQTKFADTECCQKIGDAFTQTLLRTSERDFADTVVLGNRLVDELRKRGLTITAAAESSPAPYYNARGLA